MKLGAEIRKSVYSPEFYASILHRPFWSSLKYFFSVVLVLSVSIAILLSLSLVPGLNVFLRGLAFSSAQLFPDDFVFHIENGTVSVNQPEPYKVPLPKEVASAISPDNSLQNLVVIDTSSAFSFDRFGGYHTLLWITRDSIVSGNENDARVMDLGSVKSFTLTKADLEKYAGKLQRVIRWLGPIVVFGIFLLSFLALTSTLLLFLVGAILVWVVARIKKVKLSYRKSYQVSLHAGSIGLIAYAFLFLLFFPYPPLGLSTVLVVVLTLITWFNFGEEKHDLPPVNLPVK